MIEIVVDAARHARHQENGIIKYQYESAANLGPVEPVAILAFSPAARSLLCAEGEMTLV